LASTAAVIGREFDFELLVRVSRQSEDAVLRGLDELWRRHIVREAAAGRYDFSHDRLREVAYAGLSLTRRRLLHHRAAEALEGRAAAGGGEVSRQIAHHYVLEGLGDVRQLQVLHEVARERFGAALERVQRAAPGDHARLWRKIGETLVSQYRYDEAFAALDAAEEALGRESAEAETAWWRESIDIGLARGFAHQWKGELDASEWILRSLDGPMRRHGTATERARLLVILALVVLHRTA
jgi:predicted ATPase